MPKPINQKKRDKTQAGKNHRSQEATEDKKPQKPRSQKPPKPRSHRSQEATEATKLQKPRSDKQQKPRKKKEKKTKKYPSFAIAKVRLHSTKHLEYQNHLLWCSGEQPELTEHGHPNHHGWESSLK